MVKTKEAWATLNENGEINSVFMEYPSQIIAMVKFYQHRDIPCVRVTISEAKQ